MLRQTSCLVLQNRKLSSGIKIIQLIAKLIFQWDMNLFVSDVSKLKCDLLLCEYYFYLILSNSLNIFIWLRAVKINDQSFNFWYTLLFSYFSR